MFIKTRRVPIIINKTGDIIRKINDQKFLSLRLASSSKMTWTNKNDRSAVNLILDQNLEDLFYWPLEKKFVCSLSCHHNSNSTTTINLQVQERLTYTYNNNNNFSHSSSEWMFIISHFLLYYDNNIQQTIMRFISHPTGTREFLYHPDKKIIPFNRLRILSY